MQAMPIRTDRDLRQGGDGSAVQCALRHLQGQEAIRDSKDQGSTSDCEAPLLAPIGPMVARSMPSMQARL